MPAAVAAAAAAVSAAVGSSARAALAASASHDSQRRLRRQLWGPLERTTRVASVLRTHPTSRECLRPYRCGCRCGHRQPHTTHRTQRKQYFSRLASPHTFGGGRVQACRTCTSGGKEGRLWCQPRPHSSCRCPACRANRLWRKLVSQGASVRRTSSRTPSQASCKGTTRALC